VLLSSDCWEWLSDVRGLHPAEVIAAAQQIESGGRDVFGVVAELLKVSDLDPERPPLLVVVQARQITSITQD